MPDTPERRPTDVAPPASKTGDGAARQAHSDNEHSLSDQVSMTGEQIKQQASNWTEEAKHRGKQMLHEQKSSAAEQISGVARALKQSAEQCKQEEGQQASGRVLEQAASGLEQLSDMLRNRDIDSMMQQASSLMRRQPALFVGGAIAAGFVLSRFLKSSSEHSDSQYSAAPGSHDSEAYRARNVAQGGAPADRYVTSAHVDPDEVDISDRSTDSSMPGGRDY